jgi:ketosteroid isomerase-like protein
VAEPDLKTQFRAIMEERAGDDGDLGYMDETLPALTAFAREYAAPDFECAMAGLPPTPPVVWQGVEGIEKAWADYGGTFAGVRARMTELRESETHVAVLVEQMATTRHGGVEMSQPSAMIYEFDGDRIKRIEFHLDQAEALRVAGLGQ